jgi:glycosyltransferase involved in cell wall biosynthesis
MEYKRPLISVIIPTHNRAHVLKRALLSVLRQDYERKEIIVVDDASTDNTKEIMKTFLNDPTVKYIRHVRNLGGSAARNTGIKQSHGEYIAFLDDDDEWLPNKLSLQIDVFINGNKNLGLVHCGLLRSKGGKIIYKYMPKYRGNIYFKQMFEDRVFSTSSWLVKRSCFFDNRVGMFDEDLPGRQDYDMALRISRFYAIDFVPQHLAIIHEDDNNRITDSCDKRIAGHLCVLDKIRLYSKDFNSINKRRVISYHYYSIARYLQIYGKYKEGLSFLIKSIKEWPLNIKAVVVLFFIALGDRKLKYFEIARCVTKKARGIFL